GPARPLRSPRRAPRTTRASDRPAHGPLRRGCRDSRAPAPAQGRYNPLRLMARREPRAAWRCPLATGVLAPEIGGKRAWVQGTISASDWMVPFPPVAVDELEQALRTLRRDPLPLLLLSPAQFALSACAAVMTAVGHKLRRGVGLAVIDRIPVERFSLDENRTLYWLLGSLLGRPVAQKWDGTMIYDVRDTGKTLEYGVRRSVTN